MIKTLLLGLVLACSMPGNLMLNKNANQANQMPDNLYYTNYDSKAEALEAGNLLNRKIIEEGITLLKNEDNALPLSSGAKVSIFGNYSTSLVYNGGGSGAGSGGTTLPLEDVFTNAGIQVNNELTNFYKSSASGNPGKLTGYTINAGYPIGETSVSTLSSHVSTSSYAEYNDAAFIVIGRSGMESADLPKGMSTGFDSNGNLNGKKIAGARNYDDHSLQPNQDETDLINYVSQYFDNIIILFNTGSQFEAGFLDDVGHYAYSDKIKAALWMGFAGRGDGLNALGDILVGKVSPSGHTVDTYARDFKLDPTWHNLPTYNNNLLKYSNLSNKSFVNYKEGIYEGYRYYETRGFEEGTEPYNSLDTLHNTTTTDWEDWYQAHVVYPFGYGLSYTDFTWEVVSRSEETLNKDSVLTFEVKVTNTGKYSGKDVVQLYYTAPYNEGGIEKSYVVLTDFAKTKTLNPGESDVVTVKTTLKDMASYDYNDANTNEFVGYEAEKGTYTLRLSKNAHEHVLNYDYKLEEDVQFPTSVTGQEIVNQFSDAEIKGTRYLTRKNFEETMPTTITDEERVASQEVIDTVNKTSINEQIVDDQADAPWYNDQMPKTGNNTGSIQLQDLYGLDYNDPRWDEFLNQFAVGDLNNEGMVKTIWEAGWYIKGIESLGFKTTHHEDGPSGLDGREEGGQYTNFCSETVLASTWNVDLAYKKGLHIGNEGLFGNKMSVSGIYAPSVNLHRSPFGGRNFEYYSEDPVISGKMAGHIVKGCNEKGMITFLKHFAVNEAESNRENLLTWANEQSIRELYLKPFQICVEEFNTHGIMSALNSLGATWTGGHYNLLTNVLRKEWGFEGLVITDFIQGRAQLNANQAIRAGGDIMLAKSGSVQKPAGLDKPTTVNALRRATHNICYIILHYTAIYNKDIKNIMGDYAGKTLTPAIAGIEYKTSVASALLNNGDKTTNIEYSLKEGSTLPSGLTLSKDGIISGISNDEYKSYQITVQAKYEHSIREATFTLPLIDENKSVIYIKPDNEELSIAYINEEYNQDIAWAYLGNDNGQTITYSLGQSSVLPEGLTLTSDGKIIGVPKKNAVNYKFQVTASSEGMYSMSIDLELTIGNRAELQSKTLEVGKVNKTYFESIAIDGVQGLTYSLKAGYSLPEGLTLTSEGNIVGTPHVAVSDLKFVVVSSGESYISSECEYSISVSLNYKPFTIATLKENRAEEIYVNFAEGNSNITYSITEGKLPEGLTLSKDGIISGTPTEAGNFNIVISASSEGIISDTISLNIQVLPSETFINYEIGTIIGISTLILCTIVIILFFVFLDKGNHLNGTRKINFKALSFSLTTFLTVGISIIVCINVLGPKTTVESGINTFTFEAEYTYLDDFLGVGISNSADGVNNIYGSGSQNDIDKGWSNGYFLGNTYAENTVEFVITSDTKTTGKLVLRLASELGNMNITNKEFDVLCNDVSIPYSISIPNSRTGNYDFADYPINTTLSLNEGENSIKLVIKDNLLQGGNRTGAPLIDCIKISTTSELTWEPLLDNPDNRGEV